MKRFFLALLLGALAISGDAQFVPRRALTAAQLNNSPTAASPYTSPGTGAIATTVQQDLNAQLSNVFRWFTAAQIADVTSGTHSIDDSAAIQAALNSGLSSIYLPTYTYRLSNGITIPAGVTLHSLGFAPSNPPAGTILLFDSSVPTCVTLVGVAGNASASANGFTISRAAGAIPSGSIGLLNQDTYATIVENIFSNRQAIGFEFKSDGIFSGISSMATHLYTGAISDAHVVVDTFPEVRITQSRFGMDGPGDLTANAYIRIQGGSTTNSAGGSGTIVVSDSQFNQGDGNMVGAWIAFANQTSKSISDTETWQFNNDYVEEATVGISSDSTWPSITGLMISNVEYNMPSTYQFLSLNAATQINNWTIGNSILKGAFSVSPTAQINFLNVANTQFGGNVSITGASNSDYHLTGNKYEGNLTVAGSVGNATIKGGSVSGTFTNGITTGNLLVDILPYNARQTWTPTLAFGGSSAGITYNVQQGSYQVIGNQVFCIVYLALSSVGSATGMATISNLPVPDNTSVVNGSGGGYAPYVTGMNGLSGPLFADVSSGIVNIYQANSTGLGTTSNRNFTNSTVLRLNFSYIKAGQ